MTSAISKFFRLCNSKLITIDNILLEKILKLLFYISVIIYRTARKSAAKKKITIIDNFDSNIRMKIDPARSMGAALYWTGFHEFREFIFLHKYLKENMVFVDVGANQGEYTLFAAKRLKLGSVLAFEPLTSIRNVLMENIELNKFKNISVFNYGLSDKQDVLKIHEMENAHEGLATFYPGKRKSRISFEVQLKSLDVILEGTLLDRLDFIKIDIEGGELKALRGARKVIDIFKPIIMLEINKETYKTAGYDISDVVDFFAEKNYQAYKIRKRGELEACSDLPKFGNIIFRPK